MSSHANSAFVNLLYKYSGEVPAEKKGRTVLPQICRNVRKSSRENKNESSPIDLPRNTKMESQVRNEIVNFHHIRRVRPKAGPMWQTKLRIPLSGRISRQFVPDFEISRVALHTYARRPRKIERWGKITGKPDAGMRNLCSSALPACINAGIIR
jgi:hypothetical protein